MKKLDNKTPQKGGKAHIFQPFQEKLWQSLPPNHRIHNVQLERININSQQTTFGHINSDPLEALKDVQYP